MASTTPAKRSTPAKKAKPKNEENDSDVELLSENDDETYTVRFFGEHEFHVHAQTNDWLMYMAASGEVSAITNLLLSMISIDHLIDDDTDDSEIDTIRFGEKRRFNEAMVAQERMKTERIMKIYTDLLEMTSGNDDSESSTD